MVENPNNDGYISIHGDYIIHKESDSGLLIVGNPSVGKSLLVSKFLGVGDDLTQDPDSAWNYGNTDFVHVRSVNGVHYIKSQSIYPLRYRGLIWSQSSISKLINVEVELSDDPDRDHILGRVIYLKQRGSKNRADLYELQRYWGGPEARTLIDEWKEYKMLREVTFRPKERKYILERIVADETERFTSFSTN